MELEQLIKIYTTTAKNLRKVAALAEDQNPEQAQISRTKAMVYEMVVRDLELVRSATGGK